MHQSIPTFYDHRATDLQPATQNLGRPYKGKVRKSFEMFMIKKKSKTGTKEKRSTSSNYES